MGVLSAVLPGLNAGPEETETKEADTQADERR